MPTTDSPKHIITSLTQGYCVRWYRAGHSVKQVACIMALSESTMYDLLAKAGEEMRPRGPVCRKEAGGGRPRGHPVLTRAVLAETVALRASGLTLAEVGARQGGITRQAVAWRLKEAARQNISETGGNDE